jgi:hypothetical protein
VSCTCGSDTAKETTSEATDDAGAKLSGIKAACEYKVAWPKRLDKMCVKCVSLARAPACACPKDLKDYSGRCARIQRAKLDAKDACEEVFACADKCKPTECDCKAKCFEGHDKCHEAYAAVEICLAEVCDPLCK